MSKYVLLGTKSVLLQKGYLEKEVYDYDESLAPVILFDCFSSVS